MKRLLTYLILCLPPLVSGGCVIDRAQEPALAPQTLELRIGVRSLLPSMNVRVILTDALSGKVLFNDYPTLLDDLYIVPVGAGKQNIYIIANESPRLKQQLHGLTHQSGLKKAILTYTEIDESETSSTPETYTNLPVMEYASMTVRASSADPALCEVSTDGGQTWTGTLSVQMKRIATKVTLKVRKYTQQAGDRVEIKSVHVTNVPHITHLLPRSYDGSQYISRLVGNYSLVFTDDADYNRTDNYTTVFEGYVTSEHLMGDPSDKEAATRLDISAKYGQFDVLYRIPLRSDQSAENYDLVRNTHYTILATIRSEGEFFYTPEVRYEVLEWSDIRTGHDFGDEAAIVFEAQWAAGTNVTGRDVRVHYNHGVEFSFTLTEPVGATWTATLTNPIDFEFDYSGGASSGGVVGTNPYTIRIKPRRETSLNDISTEFYITVNNGVRNIELNLPARVAGTGNRYTITQIPQ